MAFCCVCVEHWLRQHSMGPMPGSSVIVVTGKLLSPLRPSQGGYLSHTWSNLYVYRCRGRGAGRYRLLAQTKYVMTSPAVLRAIAWQTAQSSGRSRGCSGRSEQVAFNGWCWPLLPLRYRTVNDSDQPRPPIRGLVLSGAASGRTLP